MHIVAGIKELTRIDKCPSVTCDYEQRTEERRRPQELQIRQTPVSVDRRTGSRESQKSPEAAVNAAATSLMPPTKSAPAAPTTASLTSAATNKMTSKAREECRADCTYDEDFVTLASLELRKDVAVTSSTTVATTMARQMTKETKRLSISEGENGWTQLNQYKLKDEIGKVSG